jgi:hypothetical protein
MAIDRKPRTMNKFSAKSAHILRTANARSHHPSKKDPLTGKSRRENGYILSEPGADCFILTFTPECARKNDAADGRDENRRDG